MLDEIRSQLGGLRSEVRVVPLGYLEDLRQVIEDHHEMGLLDRELYRTYLSEFDFSVPESLPQARSVIVIAVPQPRIEATFAWNGNVVQAILPPTYPERNMDRLVGEMVRSAVEPAGYRVAQAVIPKKLLAVRCGMAAYGRNNITYVAGMGSFYGLVTLFSDLPAPEDCWREPVMLERCQSCSACLRHCPVGAISSERFLLHAERCITFHNEKPSEVPFPASVDPAWHNCVVGCLHCQRVCPENREVWSWVEERAAFTEEETSWLLNGVAVEQLPEVTVEKLKRSHLDRYASLLTRNLSALLSQ